MSSTNMRWMGRELDTRYLIGKRLGEGGMAVVHRARDRRLGREVAVKIMRTDVGFGDEYGERLYREARGLARLTHPHIVSIHDVGYVEGVIYLVMELLEGNDLIDVITERGHLGMALTLQIGSQVAAALAAAHQIGIIHRDIKPDNVFLVQAVTGAYTKLLDFSFASLPTEMGGGKLTEERIAYGTAHYMSPEQARAQDCTPLSDVYGLGVLLFELIAGQLPYDGSVAEVLESHRIAPVPRLVEYVDTLPMGLSDLIEQMMQKDPNRRPHSALQVAQQLSAIRESWLAELGRAAVNQARGGAVGHGAGRHVKELYDDEAYTSGETVEIRYDSDWFKRDDQGNPVSFTDTAQVKRPDFE